MIFSRASFFRSVLRGVIVGVLLMIAHRAFSAEGICYTGCAGATAGFESGYPGCAVELHLVVDHCEGTVDCGEAGELPVESAGADVGECDDCSDKQGDKESKSWNNSVDPGPNGQGPTQICSGMCAAGMVSSMCLNGGPTCVASYEFTGAACVGSETSAATAPSANCITSSSGRYCATASSEKNCGTVNGQSVCVQDVPSNNCVAMDGGAVACASSAAPPVPDNGTEGVPAEPDAVLKDAAGNTVNYYSSSTVSNSSSSVTTNGDGGEADGDGDGVVDEEEEEGSASGGESCDEQPSCDGDPILCAVLEQQWRTRCPDGPTESELEAEFTSEAPAAEEVSVGSFSENRIGAVGVCPEEASFTLFGESYELPFFEPVCNLMELLAPLFMIIGYLVAVRIAIGAGGS